MHRLRNPLRAPSDPSRFVERVTAGVGPGPSGVEGTAARGTGVTPCSPPIVRQKSPKSEECSGTHRSRSAFTSRLRARRSFARSARFFRSASRSTASCWMEALYSRRASLQLSCRAARRHRSPQYRWPRNSLTHTANHRSQSRRPHSIRTRSKERARTPQQGGRTCAWGRSQYRGEVPSTHAHRAQVPAGARCSTTGPSVISGSFGATPCPP